MICQRLGELLRLYSLAVGNDDVDRFDLEGFADVAEALAEAPAILRIAAKRIGRYFFTPSFQ